MQHVKPLLAAGAAFDGAAIIATEAMGLPGSLHYLWGGLAILWAGLIWKFSG